MMSIGQNALISHYVGRYGLGDSGKSLYGSTTSINRWRLIRVIAMKVSNGLELPVVALPGVGHMPAKGEDELDAARVFYVAATRATHRLVIGMGVWAQAWIMTFICRDICHKNPCAPL
ncbi:3'-5' exonuclease [Rhodoferax sp.]|uniref:3'-5' exonuclease n=1 Tax=Rhodoferax sp. TaxID=50421 RepID=UPI002723768F|nr:3'-5' exonuclease [Rhodoferax sp.]MDO9144242.1 3'-5' exonuclease [Rhodoferax sp.]